MKPTKPTKRVNKYRIHLASHGSLSGWRYASAQAFPSVLNGSCIPMDPLTEQRRIAEVLDQAEALRARRRAALVQLDTLWSADLLRHAPLFHPIPYEIPRSEGSASSISLIG